MKDILFRGKRTDNGEWVQGFYYERKTTEGKIIEAVIMEDMYQQVSGGMRYMRSDLHKECFRVDALTVGQYTGLTDKNGTKIFEGDIVKRLLYFGLPVLSVVTFKNGAFGLEWNRGKVKEFSAFTSICNCTYEVIGNVYDNAELLGDI